jgi:drug/metabolite transporter (DMT)-like permease
LFIVAFSGMSAAVPGRTSRSVHAILITAQVCFASLAVIGRLALHHIAPSAVLLARVAGGAIVFCALLRARGSFPLPERKHVPRLVGCALLGIVVNQFLFLSGLSRSTATNASVLGCTIPVFTLLVATVTRVERPTLPRLAGIVVALAGALILVGVDRFDVSESRVLGNLLVVMNSFCYGSFLIVVRPLSARYPAMTLVAWLFLVSLPFAVLIGAPAWVELAPRITSREVGLLAFLVAVPTVGAYSLNQLSIQRAESSLVASYVYLQPVFATIGAGLLLDELPSLRTYVAAAFIFAGLWLSASPRGSSRGVPAKL